MKVLHEVDNRASSTQAFKTTIFARIVSGSSIGFSGGGPQELLSYTYDPPIYDITFGCRVSALFLRETPRWTPMLFGFFVILTYRLMELSILNP